MASLQLTSLSSHALDKTDESYDLVFDLSSKPLPAISAINCWKGRSISPLRDRTMIEWLCSHRQGGAVLNEMTSLINKTLRQKVTTSKQSGEDLEQSETPSTSLLVAVACPSGAQHSVCFVEKLYEKYSYESHLELEVADIKLKVKREHRVATKGEWLDVKGVVWQHSKIASKHLAGCKDLLLDRSWTSFTIDVTNQIEAAFQQDPFAMKLDLGKHVVDFERGVVFNKRSRDEFKVRAAVPRLEGKVKSSWLQEKEQKSFYCGAGILFYSVHPQTGEAVFLLGHMTYSCMSWCDFGGMKDHGERPGRTAARECFEETLGVLGQTDHLLSLLEKKEENNVFQIQNKNTCYVGYYLRVPYKDYPTAFEKAAGKRSGAGRLEVNEIRWFPLSSLRVGIRQALLDQHDLSVSPLNKDGSVATSQRLPLREEFVHSMCMADQLGVLKSIEHIAKTLHATTQTQAAGGDRTDCHRQEDRDLTMRVSDLVEMDQPVPGRLEDSSQLQDKVHLDETEKSDKDSIKPKSSVDQDSNSKNRTSVKTSATADSAINSTVKGLRLHGVGAGTFIK